MDKLAEYRNIIKRVLTHYAELIRRTPDSQIETEVVIDEEHDQYLLLNVGWLGDRRMRGTTVYVRIRNGKIWIEDDWLENGITPDLLEAGVPKEDIVLGFQHPTMRQYTDFAVA